jgi:hypothetical protein
MRTITEANLEDAQEILQGFHDRFAKRIVEEVHVSILHCVETVSPVPSQITVEQLEVCDSPHSNVAILTPLEM